MPATVRLGTCSFADEGLVKSWYPRGVSTPKARLGYYAERFDTVEVDSPYYHLPDPAVTGRWAQRTPPEFVFHVKAHATMTGHEPAEQERAFAEFRSSLEPLELSGKLRGILLQYHPRFVKSDVAKEELSRVRALLEPLVPLVEFRHRSWLEDDERADTLAIPRAQRDRLRLGRRAADSRLQRRRRLSRRRRTRWRTSASTAETRRRGTSAPRSRRQRFDWMYSARGARRVGRKARRPQPKRRRGLRDVQQQPRRLRAAKRVDPPRAARRGGHTCGGRYRASTARADTLLTGRFWTAR